jgi:hypothetical protein
MELTATFGLREIRRMELRWWSPRPETLSFFACFECSAENYAKHGVEARLHLVEVTSM